MSTSEGGKNPDQNNRRLTMPDQPEQPDQTRPKTRRDLRSDRTPRKTCLIDESPLLVPPTLAAIFGIAQAVVLQQLHFWLENSQHKHQHDGHAWIYNTYETWRTQGGLWFMPERSIKHYILELERSGVVVSIQPDQFNRRKYYRIDYDALATLVDEWLDRPLDDVDHGTKFVPSSVQDMNVQNDQILSHDLTKNTQRLHDHDQPDGCQPVGNQTDQSEPDQPDDPGLSAGTQESFLEPGLEPGSAPKKSRPGGKRPTTLILEAYTQSVTSRGWRTQKTDAKTHLSALEAAGCRPEDVEHVIAWATDGQSRRQAYHLSQLPDDYKSWKAANAVRNGPERPPEPPNSPTGPDTPSESSELLERLERKYPGYGSDDLF
jgi:hypothetical protein